MVYVNLNCPTRHLADIFPLEDTDDCAMYDWVGRMRRRTHLYYLGSGRVPRDAMGPYEVTLATQLTLDRFRVLEKMLENWKGYATVVLYVSDAEAAMIPGLVDESIALKRRDKVVFHVVYKRQVRIDTNMFSVEKILIHDDDDFAW